MEGNESFKIERCPTFLKEQGKVTQNQCRDLVKQSTVIIIIIIIHNNRPNVVIKCDVRDNYISTADLSLVPKTRYTVTEHVPSSLLKIIRYRDLNNDL